MLVEEEVADEEVPEMLSSYLASVEEFLDTDTLTKLDVPLLRGRLRMMEKEGAEKEQEREQQERRRQATGSMGSSSAVREGETKEEEQQQQQPPPYKQHGEGDETHTDTATSTDTDTYTEEEAADIGFLQDIVPSNIPHDILLYVYITKCLKRRQRAAEILVESASEEGIAALIEEKVSICIQSKSCVCVCVSFPRRER